MYRYAPLLELLVYSEQLCAFIGLDVVPWSRVLLGPDNCIQVNEGKAEGIDP